MAQMVKHLPTMRETQVRSLGGKIPWRRKWQPTLVFLLEESHGWRSLVGYKPRGCKESDITERLHSLTSPPTHQKNVQELITPSFTIKRHYLPQVGEWFWGHELAVPPLPDKAIKLSFSISPKMLSLRFDLAPVYREAEFLHQQECLLFIMGSLTTPDSLCYWGNL